MLIGVILVIIALSQVQILLQFLHPAIRIDCNPRRGAQMNFMQTCNSVTFYFMENSFSDVSRKWILPNMIRAGTTMPESIHTKDESKRGIAFAFIFGVN